MQPPAFHRRLVLATVALLLTGIDLALLGAVAATTHRQPENAVVFLVVAAVLGCSAALIWRRVRWAVTLCLIALAGQSAAVVGTAWELVHGVAGIKADQLRSLGFDPELGVTLNLVYSTIGFGLFCWFAVRWSILHRSSTTHRQRDARHEP